MGKKSENGEKRKFDRAGYLIFVSHDFEFGRNVCEESTVSPAQG